MFLKGGLFTSPGDSKDGSPQGSIGPLGIPRDSKKGMTGTLGIPRDSIKGMEVAPGDFWEPQQTFAWIKCQDGDAFSALQDSELVARVKPGVDLILLNAELEKPSKEVGFPSTILRDSKQGFAGGEVLVWPQSHRWPLPTYLPTKQGLIIPSDSRKTCLVCML